MKGKTSLFSKIGNWFRTEYRKLKKLTFKERLEYYRMYYLVPALVTVFVLFFLIGGIIVGVRNSKKEDMLHVQLVGSTNANYDGWVEEYQQHRGYAENQFLEVYQGQYYDDNIVYHQATSVLAATESLDILVCEDSNLMGVLNKGMVCELTGAFTSDLLNERLCYIEFPVKVDYNAEKIESGYYYVDITGTPFTKALGIEGNAYLLKCSNTNRHEEVEAFIEYVLTQE